MLLLEVYRYDSTPPYSHLEAFLWTILLNRILKKKTVRTEQIDLLTFYP